MEILEAIKSGEVGITAGGKDAYRKGLNWQNWSVRNAVTSGFLEETELAKERAEQRTAEFRRFVEA